MLRSPSRKGLILLALPVVIAAAAWWAWVWRDVDASVLGRAPVLDEAFYLGEGAAIAEGRLLPGRPFYMSSLYPYLVAVTGSGRDLTAGGVRVGAPPTGLRVLQVLLWAGVAVSLAAAGRRLGLGRWAWLPPLLFLLYRPAAVLATSVLLEIPLTFLTALLLLRLTPREGDRAAPRPAAALATGLLVGVAALLRAHAVLLLIPAAIVLWQRARPRPWPVLAALAAGALLMIVPVAAYNSAQAGRPVGTSLNGGVNLYIGNGPEANGFFQSFLGFDVTRDPTGAAFLAKKTGRQVEGAAAADRAWTEEALRSIRERPLRALGLWARKVRLHLISPEIPQISPLAAWPEAAPGLRALVVPYGLIAALGLTGLALRLRRERRLAPWALALALLVAAQSVFFVVSRYRLVLVPILALFAAFGAAELARRRGRALAAGLAVLAVAAAAVAPWGLGGLMTSLDASGDGNLAARWQEVARHARDEGDAAGFGEGMDRAEALYRSALAAAPGYTPAYRGLAQVLHQRDRKDEARDVLAAGAQRADESLPVRQDLARLLVELGRIEEAAPVMAACLAEDPADLVMRRNLTVGLVRLGRLDEALASARRGVADFPGEARAHGDLGIVLARRGLLDEAAAALRRGLDVAPGDAALLENLRRVEQDRAPAGDAP